MSSVTSIIKNTNQPWGGYIRPLTMMKKMWLDEGDTDQLTFRCENISSSLVGTVVDYLSRLFSMEGKITLKKVDKAFRISNYGFEIYKKMKNTKITTTNYLNWKKSIINANSLDNDNLIICACKIACFDVWYRNPRNAIFGGFEIQSPDKNTINLIRKMVYRVLVFFKKNPVTVDGFTFEGGYTDKVTTGDGDFITNDTLWDMKVSVKTPDKDHSLQILMYWRMGLHSIHKEIFEKIKYLGILNPRLGQFWIIAVEDIPNEVIKEVDEDIIGY